MEEPGGMKSKELFPAVFSRHASAYKERLDQIMARGQARGRQRVIDFLGVRPGMRVLDLACGPGTLTRVLASQAAPGGEVIGVDLAPGMIELARAADIPHARFEVMDIERLTFHDSSFDAAACGHGLQFVPDLNQALAEAHRVLKSGARFGASVPGGAADQGPWSLVQQVVDRHLPPAPEPADRRATRDAVLDVEQFTHAALAAGFVQARVEVIEEKVQWKSADELVSRFVSWWSCAARLDGIDEEKRQSFAKEALSALKRDYPGAIETTDSNHVLLAVG